MAIQKFGIAVPKAVMPGHARRPHVRGRTAVHVPSTRAEYRATEQRQEGELEAQRDAGRDGREAPADPCGTSASPVAG